MTRRDVTHRSSSDEHATPQHVFDDLAERFGPFDLDTAATADNTKCKTFYTIADDALAQPWNGRVWCNPPYSRNAAFIEHAIRELQAGNASVVVMLLPARSQTIWWREAFEHAEIVEGVSGALKFGDATDGAPFGSTILVLRVHPCAAWNALADAPLYRMPKRHNTRPTRFDLKTPRVEIRQLKYQ